MFLGLKNLDITLTILQEKILHLISNLNFYEFSKFFFLTHDQTLRGIGLIIIDVTIYFTIQISFVNGYAKQFVTSNT